MESSVICKKKKKNVGIQNVIDVHLTDAVDIKYDLGVRSEVVAAMKRESVQNLLNLCEDRLST